MSCEFEEDLSAYVDGELPQVRAHALKLHLEGCADCRSVEALIRRTTQAVGSLPAFEPSPQLRRAVLQKMDDQVEAGLKQRVRRMWQLLIPLAGAAALGGLLFFVARGSEDVPEVLEPQLAELAMNLDAVEDLDVAGLDEDADFEVITSLHELKKETP